MRSTGDAIARGELVAGEPLTGPHDQSRLYSRLAELERTSGRLERYAAIAAHELSEPLVATEAYSALLADRLGPDADPLTRSYLVALERSAARLRLVVETLLHEARCTQLGPPARRPVALADVVADCKGVLVHEIIAREARVVVGRLPVVTADESLLGIVMKNLLSNALRYGPRRGASIRISAARRQSAWRISVVSEGPAIPAEDRERIFAPFERGSGERRAIGTGLGLAICRDIVERHGGTMGVEPCPRGNRFYFTIVD